jgi:hypothetical protein
VKIKIFVGALSCAAVLLIAVPARASGLDTAFKAQFTQQFLPEYWRMNRTAAGIPAQMAGRTASL